LVGPFYKPTPEIVKKSSSGEIIMPANFMEMDEFVNISSVLYCGHHAYDCKLNGHEVGDDFLFAYHVNPINPIPDNFFDFGTGIHKNTINNSIIMQSQSLTAK